MRWLRECLQYPAVVNNEHFKLIVPSLPLPPFPLVFFLPYFVFSVVCITYTYLLIVPECMIFWPHGELAHEMSLKIFFLLLENLPCGQWFYWWWFSLCLWCQLYICYFEQAWIVNKVKLIFIYILVSLNSVVAFLWMNQSFTLIGLW